jgi:hypothetical protein
MPLITALANAIRRDEPTNLFCIVEFGDGGNVEVFSSGRGWAPRGDSIDPFRRNRRIEFCNDNQSADGEERMTWYSTRCIASGETGRATSPS